MSQQTKPKKPRYVVTIPSNATLRGLFTARETARQHTSGASEKNPAWRYYHEADDILAKAVLTTPTLPQGPCSPAPRVVEARLKEARARDFRSAHEQRRRELATAHKAATEAFTDNRPDDGDAIVVQQTQHRWRAPFEDDRYSRRTEKGG